MEREFHFLANYGCTQVGKGCDKVTVVAGAYDKDGLFHMATNYCTHEGDTCPRINMQSGENYHLCQSHHAEANLMKKMKGNLDHRAVVWVLGHYWVCEPCGASMRDNGVKEIRVHTCGG